MGALVQGFTWYMDITSLDMIVEKHETGLSSTVRQPT